mmetsp:Transcript_9705/g.14920  ORF Transcript_9705/g.14920 Transcript_9705/m.14920 type:complete len:202 (-) Transcript_9705:154-759(-)
MEVRSTSPQKSLIRSIRCPPWSTSAPPLSLISQTKRFSMFEYVAWYLAITMAICAPSRSSKAFTTSGEYLSIYPTCITRFLSFWYLASLLDRSSTSGKGRNVTGLSMKMCKPASAHRSSTSRGGCVPPRILAVVPMNMAEHLALDSSCKKTSKESNILVFSHTFLFGLFACLSSSAAKARDSVRFMMATHSTSCMSSSLAE